MIKKILGLYAALLVISPAYAFAHGEMVRADPAANSRVISAPMQVSIEFDGKLQVLGNATINSMTVKDDKGQVISEPVSTVDGMRITSKLTSLDVTGLISVSYRIVSEDGHPVEGEYSFTVGETPVAMSAYGEETAEEEVETAEENGGNSLVNGVGILILIGIVFGIVRRIKK
jgi:methionine-rich copper-binding protein CopC